MEADPKSPRDIYEAALACETRAQASAWMKCEMKKLEDRGYNPEEARHLLLSNLGYNAGYYDHSMSEKVFNLFGAVHPILGAPWEKEGLNPEEVFQLGVRMGKGLKDEQLQSVKGGGAWQEQTQEAMRALIEAGCEPSVAKVEVAELIWGFKSYVMNLCRGVPSKEGILDILAGTNYVGWVDHDGTAQD